MTAFRSGLSLRYFLLRMTTAGGAVLFGFVQTFVFARVLSPDRFAMFILVGTIGISLWLFDFGIAKILFVKTREWWLTDRTDRDVARQNTSVVGVYFLLVVAGSLICFAVTASQKHIATVEAAQFSAFFLFSALNLVWLALRNVSVAADEFLYFETLEAMRRVGHIAMLVSLLAGLPLTAFLAAAVALWAILLTLAIMRLQRRGAMTLRIQSIAADFTRFVARNGRQIRQSGTFAACELYIYNFPYVLWPLWLGLGAPTIILDTSFKIVRGSGLIYGAACDSMVMQQTRAYAARDAALLTRATLTAGALCALPALVLAALLLFAGDRFFAFLLGPAATMPAAATPIIIVLLIANALQTVSNYVLLHTGYFKELSRLALLSAVAMTIATLFCALRGADIVGYLTFYAAVYLVGAVLYAVLAARGPLRTARQASAAQATVPL
ncbi:MAG TPA: hypothetical protein VL402_05810 [Xanthobacteraceae bacterium]|jgi:O-antigen/teichoic acid export membrane protein|nr:hypothetical protein [Xanthobacteraceae bacterium]